MTRAAFKAKQPPLKSHTYSFSTTHAQFQVSAAQNPGLRQHSSRVRQHTNLDKNSLLALGVFLFPPFFLKGRLGLNVIQLRLSSGSIEDFALCQLPKPNVIKLTEFVGRPLVVAQFWSLKISVVAEVWAPTRGALLEDSYSENS